MSQAQVSQDIGGSTFKWLPGDIRCLIQLYADNVEKFEIMLKSKVWANIATDLSKSRGKLFTGDQCDGKWKGLKSQSKKISDHNNSSGNSRRDWDYFSAIDAILFKRPEINPPATCSSDDVAVVVNTSNFDFYDCIIDESSNTTPPPLQRKRTANETEKAKEMRHKEKWREPINF